MSGLAIIGLIISIISGILFVNWGCSDDKNKDSAIVKNIISYYLMGVGMSMFIGGMLQKSDEKLVDQAYMDSLIGKNKYSMEVHYKILPDSTYIPSDTSFIENK